jgi:hypothetical protein
MTVRWTFEVAGGAYPDADFDGDNPTYGTTCRVDRARWWITAQAARRAAARAGFGTVRVVRVPQIGEEDDSSAATRTPTRPARRDRQIP